MAQRKKTKQKQTRNRISNVDFFNLCNYLQDQQDHLEGRTTDAIAKRVEEDTGIGVTANNLKRAKRALEEQTGQDMSWIAPTQRRAPAPNTDTDPTTRILARGLVNLHEAWDVEAPADLKRLAR